VRARAAPWLLGALLLSRSATARPEEGAPPGPRGITFAEAVDLALAHNLDLRSARVTALLRRFDIDEAEARWDPAMEAAANVGETLLPSRDSLAGADVVDVDRTGFSAGVTKPFRLGPSLGLAWRADRSFTNSSFSTINPAYDTALDLTLTVPLLRGRGREAQEAVLRASRAGAEEAVHALHDEAERLVRSVADAYWNLVYLDRRVGVLEKSVGVAREIEASERRKLAPEIGRSTLLDVTQAEAETKRREVTLLQGRLDAENAADNLRALVLPFTGGLGDGRMLRAVEMPREGGELPPLAGMIERGLRERPDLARIDAEIERLREGVVAAQDAMRFQLDLTATGTWRGVDGDLERSAADTLSGKTPSAAAALLFRWPFGRRAARAALGRAELEVEAARIRRERQVNTVVVEVRGAHRGVRTAVEGIAASREEVRAAAASLDGERQRLARGSSTVLDVSRLEENLTAAELRLLEAQTRLEQARIALERAAGTLLDRLAIRIGGARDSARAADG